MGVSCSYGQACLLDLADAGEAVAALLFARELAQEALEDIELGEFKEFGRAADGRR